MNQSLDITVNITSVLMSLVNEYETTIFDDSAFLFRSCLAGIKSWYMHKKTRKTKSILKVQMTVKYRGVGLIRTMEIAKKSYELDSPCKSKFLTKKMIFI